MYFYYSIKYIASDHSLSLLLIRKWNIIIITYKIVNNVKIFTIYIFIGAVLYKYKSKRVNKKISNK